MNRKYIAQGRYGYVGIDMYLDDQCVRTVITGIKPQKLGYQFAELLQSVYAQGRQDVLDEQENK